MIQMINNSSEITMQIILRCNGCFIPQFLVYWLWCCKARWKNLIHNLVCCPLRHLKHFFLTKVLRTVEHSVPVCNAFPAKLIVAVIYLFSLHIRKFKIIAEAYQMHLKLCLIIIMKLWCGNLLHRNRPSRILPFQWYVLVLIMENDLFYIIFFYLHTYHE